MWTHEDRSIMERVNNSERRYYLAQREKNTFLGWLLDLLVGGD